MRNSKKYNESLVKKGEVLLDIDVIDSWHLELEEMNKDKEGRKFVYPDLFIKLLKYMRAYFHLPYKQTDGRCSMITCFKHGLCSLFPLKSSVIDFTLFLV
ncbi:MAG TPA: transposase [Nitrososphaeraceae archaeon]|nr:transposase [Nitrososphaeraceae archaeon]